MLGDTPAAKSRTREFVALADEAKTMFSFWARKVNPVFTGQEEMNRDWGRLAAERYHRRLRQLDMLMTEARAEFLTGEQVTIADCVTSSTMQFAHDLYHVAPTESTPRLIEWYHHFVKRPSAQAAAFPEELRNAVAGLPTLTAASAVDNVT